MQSVSISVLSVKEIWQRIVYDQWIVGVDVQNTSKRYMRHLSCVSFSFPILDKNLISSNNNNKAHMSGDENKENHQVMHCKNFDVMYHIIIVECSLATTLLSDQFYKIPNVSLQHLVSNHFLSLELEV